MPMWVQMFLQILVAALASSGLWTFVQKKAEKKDARTRMLLGLAHDCIVERCAEYLARGYIYQSEYENLTKYLYKPYLELGGNGLVKRMMTSIEKLPLKGDVNE